MLRLVILALVCAVFSARIVLADTLTNTADCKKYRCTYRSVKPADVLTTEVIDALEGDYPGIADKFKTDATDSHKVIFILKRDGSTKFSSEDGGEDKSIANNEIRTAVVETLQEFDSPTSSLVNVRVNIFAFEWAKGHDTNWGFSALERGVVSTGTPRLSLATTAASLATGGLSDMTSLVFNAGNRISSLFSVNLGFARGQGWVRSVHNKSCGNVINFRNFSCERTRVLYLVTDVSAPQQETAGFKMSGNISIQDDYINVDNFNFRFGVPDKEDERNALRKRKSESLQELVNIREPKKFRIGVPEIIHEDFFSGEIREEDGNFIFYQKDLKRTVSRKLVVAVTMDPVDERAHLLANNGLSRQKLQPGSSNASLIEVMDGLRVHTVANPNHPFGQAVVLSYEREKATIHNLQKRVHIKVLGGGLDYTTIASVENMMQTGHAIEMMEVDNFCQDDKLKCQEVAYKVQVTHPESGQEMEMSFVHNVAEGKIFAINSSTVEPVGKREKQKAVESNRNRNDDEDLFGWDKSELLQ